MNWGCHAQTEYAIDGHRDEILKPANDYIRSSFRGRHNLSQVGAKVLVGQ